MTATPASRALGLMLAAWCVAGLPARAGADDAAAVGLDDLALRIGPENLPTGADVLVAQVEAPTGGGAYRPNPNHEDFVGKNFILMSGASANSSHATNVGRRYYGTAIGIAPAISDIHVWEANHWATTGFLHTSSGLPPDASPTGLKLFNHSWVGTLNSNSMDNNALRRADFVMSRDDLLMFVGVNNGGGTNYALLSHLYNGLSVGVEGGGHLSADTLVGIDGPGRMKPEIVAPGTLTSFSTPIAAAAGALMVETARAMSAGADPTAERGEVIKAVLMAGANHRPGWTNNPEISGPLRGTTGRPLDSVYGADLVNVNMSHMILTGRQQFGLAAPPASINARHAGWDLTTVGIGESRYWRLKVCDLAAEVSILATWHRQASSPFGSGNWAVADFDLILWRLDVGEQLVTLVGDDGLAYFGGGNVASESQVDNIEHLYVLDLEPSEYVLELRRLDNEVVYPDYDAAVAWLLPDPGIIGDIDGDCVVGITDFLKLIARWGPCPEPCPPSCPADIDGDCEVGVTDFLQLLAHWD
ncbi:MAG: hypothetical protein ACYTEY_02275 [Planctomycetota bacterium]